MNVNVVSTQDNLLLSNLMEFYNNEDNLNKMLKIITGDSVISLRIVDWFATNYAKKIIRYINYKEQKEDLKYIMIIN